MRTTIPFEPFLGVWPVVHPSAFVHASSSLIGRVEVGAEASIWCNCTLRGDEGRIVIGASTNIQDGTTIHMTGGRSEVLVGERVTVGHNVLLHGCVVEDECLIGMGALLMDNVRVGRGSLIGAGTFITADKVIPPCSLVFGNPHRILRPVGPNERKAIEHGWKHYVEHGQRYLDLQRMSNPLPPGEVGS